MEKEEMETVADITSKTWNIMENSLKKEGFREGAAAGNKSVFQPNFDSGYSEGFKLGYAKGFLKGVLSALKAEEKPELNLTEIKNDLATTPCILCEATLREKLETDTYEEILIFLRENSDTNINSLKCKYSEELEKMGIQPQMISCVKE